MYKNLSVIKSFTILVSFNVLSKTIDIFLIKLIFCSFFYSFYKKFTELYGFVIFISGILALLYTTKSNKVNGYFLTIFITFYFYGYFKIVGNIVSIFVTSGLVIYFWCKNSVRGFARVFGIWFFHVTLYYIYVQLKF